MSPRSYLPLLGALLISRVVAQNESCTAREPANYTSPIYSFEQPFLPYLAPNGTQSVDDSDTAIKYVGQWITENDPAAVNSTLHSTNDTSASLSFTFTGTGIEWFGTTGNGHGIAKVRHRESNCNHHRPWLQVTLDSTPPVAVQVSGMSNEPYDRQRLWSMLELPLREYTLTIQNTAGGGDGHLLTVDAFVVTLNPSVVIPGGRVSHADGWSLVQRGLSGVSAMQLTIVSPTHAIIFDKVEHNYASIRGSPASSVLYDINTDELQPLFLESNSFCASGAFLSNGTLISIGGNRPAVVDTNNTEFHDVDGRQSIRIFEPCSDPASGACNVLDMVNASRVERWYPTPLRITDGSLLVIGGSTENVFMNNHSINQPSVSFFPDLLSTPAQFPFDFLNRTLNANLFPHAFSLPNKRAFVIANTDSIFFDWGASPPAEEAETYPLPNGVRVTYPMGGAALLLPLSSAENYTSRILVCGGSTKFDMLCNFEYSAFEPASSQCSRIEIKRDGTTEGWQLDEPMAGGARLMNDGVLLPTGEVVMVNGARAGFMGFGSVIDPIGFSNAAFPALSPIVYSPDKPLGQRWQQLRVRTDIARFYHSVATLTPNGDIMITGSNPNADRELALYPADYRVEWLSPPYMTAARPSYTGLGRTVDYGTTFTLDVEIPAELDRSKINGTSQHASQARRR